VCWLLRRCLSSKASLSLYRLLSLFATSSSPKRLGSTSAFEKSNPGKPVRDRTCRARSLRPMCLRRRGKERGGVIVRMKGRRRGRRREGGRELIRRMLRLGM
jgi:hypothetical protein